MFTLSAGDGDDGPAGQVTYKMEEEGNLENGNAVFSVGCKFILLQLFGRKNWSNRCAVKKTQLPELRTTNTQRKLARNLLYVLASCNYCLLLTLPTQPETRKLKQVCYHQADIRMRSHRLLRLDDNKSVTSC